MSETGANTAIIRLGETEPIQNQVSSGIICWLSKSCVNITESMRSILSDK